MAATRTRKSVREPLRPSPQHRGRRHAIQSHRARLWIASSPDRAVKSRSRAIKSPLLAGPSETRAREIGPDVATMTTVDAERDVIAVPTRYEFEHENKFVLRAIEAACEFRGNPAADSDLMSAAIPI
jgi:hypothetical protein